MPYQLDNNKLNNLNDYSKEMIVIAFNTLQRIELVDFFVNYTPPVTNGYMFDDNPIIDAISKQISIDNNNHSGASLAFTLRLLKNLIIKL